MHVNDGYNAKFNDGHNAKFSEGRNTCFNEGHNACLMKSMLREKDACCKIVKRLACTYMMGSSQCL